MKLHQLIFLITGFLFLPFLADAQLQPSSIQSSAVSSDEDLATMLEAIEQVTPVPFDATSKEQRYGTYWSAQHAQGTRNEWPPLPGNFYDLPIWPLGDGNYLLDDRDLNYSALDKKQHKHKKMQANTQTMVMSADDLTPPGFDDTNSEDGDDDLSGSSFVPIDYGTNLWIAQVGFSGGYLTGIASNTLSDVEYEIQSKTDLTQNNWVSEGFIAGPELTNWISLSIPQNGREHLFIRLRSWLDSTGTGIPDWWWLTYFGQITNVDASASAAGDGYSNLQKFQLGLNPTNYYNPNALAGFAGSLDASETNVVLEWNASLGPVTYSIQRGIQDTDGNYVFTQIGTVNSNATFFIDAGVTTNANWQNNIYNIEASYPNSGIEATNTWTVWWYFDYGSYGAPYGPTLPNSVYAYSDTTNVFLSWTAAGISATNYIIERGVDNSGSYTFSPIAYVDITTTNYEVVNVMTNGNWDDEYAIVAVYPGGGLSQPAYASINAGVTTSYLPAPTGIYGYVDGTGTNFYISWNPSAGAVKYLVYGESYDYDSPGSYLETYTLLGSTTTTSFEEVGGNAWGYPDYESYVIIAIYGGGSQSQGGWMYPNDGGIPSLTAFYANIDRTGTNVVLTWPPVTGATGYMIQRCDYGGYYYYQISSVNAEATYFVDTNEVNNAPYGIANVSYELQAIFPHGGMSSGIYTNVSTNLPSVYDLTVTTDNTNAYISWNLLPGISQYVIERGVYNPTNGTYTYTQIATVSGGSTTYEDADAITGPNSYNNVYQVIADYSGGGASPTASVNLYNSTLPNVVSANLNISAQLVRNEQGRWQLIFSSIPANVQSIALSWYVWDYFYDSGIIPTLSGPGYPYPYGSTTYIPVNALTNGIYVIPDSMTVPVILSGNPNGWTVEYGWSITPGGNAIVVQPVTTNGMYGNATLAGLLPYDEPAFADGREELKQNLLYELRSASTVSPNSILAGTNYAESGFLHYATDSKGYNSDYVNFVALDDLWPFNFNYQLHSGVYDPTYMGASSFEWTGDLSANPASAILGISDPYWTSDLFFVQGIDPATGLPVGSINYTNLAYYGSYTDDNNIYLQSGAHNLWGLEFETALVNLNPFTTLAPGGSVALTNINCFYSQTADPELELMNYYFSPVSTPGTVANNENPQYLYYPIPPWPGFNPTNQTGLMVVSVGTPAVIGGWAKFAIANGDPNKFAYLGQYFETNAFLITNGVMSADTMGVVSPYGNFFPTQPGMVAMITMPDIDIGAQGTGIVRVVALNADANHDGTMDFSYNSPDFVSSSKPFRFWINDNQDVNDYGGDGIPGKMGTQGDANNYTDQYGFNDFDGNGLPLYHAHGRRDLVDFFPVYLNIGSLFQSNALSAGINYADTNWQFVLSQNDGVLRFAYTDLTPTNYMNFLQDTNESGILANALLTMVTANGVSLTNTFIADIATNNGGVILVEAAAATTQPLVLTIFHGTNQIAQTQLPLSISGVEQMFRQKNLLLNATPSVPDRLNDFDVPNEPDTIDKNFIFVHGYNVNPNEARGVAADIFKRMYWSGSHAKFWAVTWEGADTKGTAPFYSLLTPNYHSNLFNAFLTAPILNDFLNSLTGPNIVAAHSLGNIVVLDALNDYSNQSINTYFMLDAAVPIEAIDSTSSNTNMIPSAWQTYSNRLYASDWSQLFSTNDNRNTLVWNGRLANLQNADVYNIYSSGEEVLREDDADAPFDFVTVLDTQLADALIEGVPFGTYVWVWQEKGKGDSTEDWLVGSSHGGWKFNANYATLTVSQANALSNPQLKTNAFFDLTSSSFGNSDLELYNSSGSSYAQINRSRILSDVVPALSLPVGANPVPSFDNNHNLNMNSPQFQNGWPQGRLAHGEKQNKWYHSDFHQVAYTFTYQLFNQMVTTGNLK